MNSNYVMTLFESAEKIGLISTLAPFGNDIKISIPLSQKFCDKSIDEMSNLCRRGRRPRRPVLRKPHRRDRASDMLRM